MEIRKHRRVNCKLRIENCKWRIENLIFKKKNLIKVLNLCYTKKLNIF